MNKDWTILLATCLAMLAFAANSVLCRLALGQQLIDAGSFTAVRLLSGSLVLLLLLEATSLPGSRHRKGNWLQALMLFTYALTFSYAYIQLETGTGALILFGAVQITLITSSIVLGERLRAREWIGLAMACAGLVWLLLPGLGAPSPLGFVLMAVAGISWGLYTLFGRNSRQPLAQTSFNFLRTLPLVVVLLLLTYDRSQVSVMGLVLAIASGGIASGVGYAIWYYALTGLSLTQAAVVQLTVPLLAAAGGLYLVQEPISLRFWVSSLLILGGVLLVLLSRKRSKQG